MANRNSKAHGVIHVASLAAASVGAGLAQIPGSDAPLLTGIQATMIIGIADLHGVSIGKAAAAKLILPFSAMVGGRALSQLLVG